MKVANLSKTTSLQANLSKISSLQLSLSKSSSLQSNMAKPLPPFNSTCLKKSALILWLYGEDNTNLKKLVSDPFVII